MSNTDQTRPPYLSILRGGRLAKIGKRAASYAPVLCLVGAAALFGASPAQAVNECGAENLADPADTITCGPGNYAGGSDYPNFPSGITYNGSDGLTLILDDPAIVVNNSGPDPAGVSITTSPTSTGDVSLFATRFDTITTVGTNAAGLRAIKLGTGDGDITVQMDEGEINTNGYQANAVQAWMPSVITANRNVTVRMTGGAITVEGYSSDGLTATNRASSGNTLVEMSVGSILLTETSGIQGPGQSNASAYGISAYQLNSMATGNVTVRMTGGEIFSEAGSEGTDSAGITVNNNGRGASSIEVSNGASIQMTGMGSHGISLTHLSLDESYEIVVSNSASVTGGYGSGVGIVTGSLSPGMISIGANAAVGAYSDAAIRTQVDRFPPSISTGAVEVINDGTITGTLSFDNQGDLFTNNSINSWNIRNFADTDGDLVRDEEAVALSDFGGGTDTFSNTGTVRLLTVEDMSGFTPGVDDDIAPVTWDETALYFTPGSAGLTDPVTYGIQGSGIEQGHIVNLESFQNAGLITMADAETGGNGPVAGDVMVITGGATAGTSNGGQFVSNRGGLHIDTVLNDGAVDITDVLVVDQAVLGTGATGIIVSNAGGTGASTDLNGNGVFDTDEGILVVQALENGSEAGAFALSRPVLAGAWQYVLDQTDGQSWYLHSLVSSTGAVYEAAPSVLGAAFNRLPTLEQRVGQRQWAGQSGAPSEGQPNTGAWVRFSGDKLDATTTTGSSIDSNTWDLQAGIDFAVEPGDAGQWVLGVTGQYGQVSSTVTSALGFGTIDAEGFGLGATATWYGNTGTYVDLQGQVNWIDSDISSSAAGALAEGELSKAYALSAEVGHRFALNETSSLVPQAQLMWGRIDGGSFTDSAGNAVELGSNDRTIGRIGLAYEYTPDTAAGGNPTKAYVIGNILHDFSGDSSVTVAGADLGTSFNEATWGEIGVGGSYAMNANTTLYGEAAYRASFGANSDNNGLSGTVGLRIQW